MGQMSNCLLVGLVELVGLVGLSCVGGVELVGLLGLGWVGLGWWG